MTAERGESKPPFVNTDRYFGDFGHHDDRVDNDEPEYEHDWDWDISGEAYAWGKMAYSIYESHAKLAYRDTQGLFTAVDLCSAFPLNAQILRDYFREDRFSIARNIITNLINDFWLDSLDPELSDPETLNEESKRKLFSELTAPYSPTRRFLTIATLDLLCDPPLVDNNKEGEERIIVQTDHLVEKFYHYVQQGGRLTSLDFYKNMGMEKLYRQNQERTLDKLIRSETGIEDSSRLLSRFVLYIAASCTMMPGKFTVLSLDNETPDKLYKGALKGFPELFHLDFVFDGTWDNMHKYHLQADIFNLPFSKNSLSFITSVEGYPFYFPGLSLENQDQNPNHLTFAQSIIDVLKPGGRAVFFPWHTKRQTRQDAENLKETERFWKEKGMEVCKERHNRFKLLMGMGDREKDLASHSPLFTDNPLRMNYTTLVLTKPKTFNSSQEAT